jgi:hypothetical protein
MKASRYLALMAVIAGAPACAIFLATQAVGCGGSETSAGPPASRDAGEDVEEPGQDGSSDSGIAVQSDATAPNDAAVGADAAPEASEPVESSTPTEGGPAEAGPAEAGPAEAGPAEAGPAEAGPAEAGPPDASTDATTSEDGSVDATVQNDSGGTGADASPDTSVQVDAGFDAASCSVTVPTASGFVNALSTVQCESLQQCCGIAPANFNLSGAGGCVPTFNAIGWLGDTGPAAFLNGGRMAYNSAAACACLEGNVYGTISCVTVPDTEYGPLESVCESALQGTSGAGGPCASSWECMPGFYCSEELTADPDDAGALGTCSALLAVSDPCTKTDECTYIGSGTPTAYCNTSVTPNVCTSVVSDGNSCPSPNGASKCSSGICSSSICQSGFDFSSSARCTAFVN